MGRFGGAATAGGVAQAAPGPVTGPFPVLYADAFFLDGDSCRKKPGHLAAGEAVPKSRQVAEWLGLRPALRRPRLLRLRGH